MSDEPESKEWDQKAFEERLRFQDNVETKRVLRQVRDADSRWAEFDTDALELASMLEPGNFGPNVTIRGIERAESQLATGLSQLFNEVNSGLVYEPGYAERTRETIYGQYEHDAQAWQDNLYAHVDLVDAALRVVTSQLENPRQTWQAARVAEADQHLAGARRALAVYSLAQLEPQLEAAMAADKATVLDGWREALLEYAGQHGSDPLTSDWLARLTSRLAQDPQLLRVRDALNSRRAAYEAGAQRVAQLLHRRRVEINQLKLIKSGMYGDRLAGRPTVTNTVTQPTAAVMEDLTDQEWTPPRRRR